MGLLEGAIAARCHHHVHHLGVGFHRHSLLVHVYWFLFVGKINFIITQDKILFNNHTMFSAPSIIKKCLSNL